MALGVDCFSLDRPRLVCRFQYTVHLGSVQKQGVYTDSYEFLLSSSPPISWFTVDKFINLGTNQLLSLRCWLGSDQSVNPGFLPYGSGDLRNGFSKCFVEAVRTHT